MTGVDADPWCVRRARAAGGGVAYVEADVLVGAVPGAPFDLVSCVAALHHLGSATGLRRLRGALAGTLPGARCRRHAPWRYSLVWTSPTD